MSDDETPDSPRGAGDQPDPDATPPAETPGVTPEEPTTGSGDGDATSVLAATGAGSGTGAEDATSVLAATTAGEPVRSRYVGPLPAEQSEGDTESNRGWWASMNRGWLIAIVAAVVVLAGAGVALAVTSGTTKKPQASPPRDRTGAATFIPAPTGPACPLTGQPAPGGQVPKRPALAFKVDNYPDARPQSGLTGADVIFEEPVEGGITRLVAVFQCQDAQLVGPIRSARAIDVPILDQLSKPLLVHAGGINPVIALLNSGNLINDDVFTHAGIVQHPPGRQAPYDTYASTSAAWALNPFDTTPPAPLYTYSNTVPAGTAVSSVHIRFTSTNDNLWTWSPITGEWLLSIGSLPANTANGGGRIAATNIVVQTVHITYGPWLENSEGGLEVQAQLVGFGPLAVFRNGEEITGSWQRAALGDTTKLVASDGSTIALQPGKTWVELVPSTIPVITTAGSAATSGAVSPSH
ncbi:MAG TPA: DUF3048 domain-containing protein [Acidimicrobiales bacterium]|nr:DUF3048 domain-containing protein [Acidimicrobiales bacterium]